MARRFCPIFLMQPQLLLLLLLLLLLHLTSPAHARDISTISSKPSLPDFPPSAHQENAVTGDLISMMEDECRRLGSEECIVKRFMLEHTDYIYTQDLPKP
ncbi:phytosulfokines-like [Punica granatum]|uniref:Phytosulfokine n=1 Tax=Punica granatum TaxID=22663 RepID=A0A218WUG5_PUNGR|nr:phytosulfokines-like [Punica granatum]OWM75851.1 hypothetical protein CDL15_Pgr009495 [Punica granatum]